MNVSPGTRLGPYEITGRLGAGGMGEVFRARDERIGRDVAIKILPSSFAADPVRLQRFKEEARSAGTLNHPNLVTIFDIGSENGAPFIVMELLDGVTLRDKLGEQHGDLKKNLMAIADVANAIAAAHAAGVVHRDLKPENIVVTNSGYTKVLDFGLAKLITAAPADGSTTAVKKTDPGVVLGTAGYMSPEQAQGRPADHRSDIFSIGSILYETLTGQRAFAGNSSIDTMHNIIHADPPPVRSIRPEVSPELQRITRKCLAKDPDERYQSARDLAIDLRAAVRDLGSAPEVAVVPASKRPVVPLLIGALAIAAIAGAIAWYAALRTRPAAPSVVSIRPLTSSGDVIEAAISPDGKYLAYVTSRAGVQALWLRQMGTAQSIQLIPPARVNFWAHAFSPDGSSIYYGIKESDAAGALYRIATLGGTSQKILTGIDSCVSFSPDGKQIAYERANYPASGHSALLIANADGSGIRVLAEKKSPELFAPMFFGGPAWSPDGRRIAASVMRAGGGSEARLSEFDAGSGKETPIAVPGWRTAAQSVWSPDGRVAYTIATASSDLATRLWRVAIPGGETRRITTGIADWRNPSITADGKQIVAVAAQSATTVSIYRASDGVLLRNIGGTQRDGGGGVAYAPNGRVIYTSNVADVVELWACDSDGGNRQQITTRASLLRDPVVTSDGRIVFVAYDKGAIDLWRVNLDGTGLTRIMATTVGSVPSVSPDGRIIYFSADLAAGRRLYRLPIDGGQPVAVTDFTMAAPTVSPDGKTIAGWCAIGNERPALGLIDAGSGRLLRRFDEAGADTFSTYRFSTDGKTLYYNATAFLKAIDLTTGKIRTVVQYEPPDGTPRFDVGKDGTLLVAHGPYTRDAFQITGFE